MTTLLRVLNSVGLQTLTVAGGVTAAAIVFRREKRERADDAVRRAALDFLAAAAALSIVVGTSKPSNLGRISRTLAMFPPALGAPLLAALIEQGAILHRAGIEFRVLVPREDHPAEYAAVDAVLAALDDVQGLGVRASATETRRRVDAVGGAASEAIAVLQRDLLQPARRPARRLRRGQQ